MDLGVLPPPPSIRCLMLDMSSPRMLSLLQQYRIGLTQAEPASASTLSPRSSRRKTSVQVEVFIVMIAILL